MFTIKNILVPTDFSENAADAYPYARQIAERYDAKVNFVHIIPTLSYFHDSLSTLSIPLNMEKDVYPEVREQAARRIGEIMDSALPPAHKGKGIVEIAPNPAREITDLALRDNYDVIVMASNGQHATDLLRGSITEKVIRLAKVPVLSTQKSDVDEINNILVPVDGSQLSYKALPMALSVALTFNASITLFHVIELYGSPVENAPKNPHKTKEENLRDSIYAGMEQFLAGSWDRVEHRTCDDFESQLVYTEGASSDAINVHTVIEKDVSAHHAIRTYAEEHADMVVMATHGYSGLTHLFLGSVAEKLAQHLALPVITVKPDFDEMKK